MGSNGTWTCATLANNATMLRAYNAAFKGGYSSGLQIPETAINVTGLSCDNTSIAIPSDARRRLLSASRPALLGRRLLATTNTTSNSTQHFVTAAFTIQTSGLDPVALIALVAANSQVYGQAAADALGADATAQAAVQVFPSPPPSPPSPPSPALQTLASSPPPAGDNSQGAPGTVVSAPAHASSERNKLLIGLVVGLVGGLILLVILITVCIVCRKQLRPYLCCCFGPAVARNSDAGVVVAVPVDAADGRTSYARASSITHNATHIITVPSDDEAKGAVDAADVSVKLPASPTGSAPPTPTFAPGNGGGSGLLAASPRGSPKSADGSGGANTGRSSPPPNLALWTNPTAQPIGEANSLHVSGNPGNIASLSSPVAGGARATTSVSLSSAADADANADAALSAPLAPPASPATPAAASAPPAASFFTANAPVEGFGSPLIGGQSAANATTPRRSALDTDTMDGALTPREIIGDPADATSAVGDASGAVQHPRPWY